MLNFVWWKSPFSILNAFNFQGEELPPGWMLRINLLRHRPPNSPGHGRPRPRGSPWHDLHWFSPLQRSCEYSKAFAVHGPKILLWTIQNSVYPALLCLSAASSRVCIGGQLPNTEGGYEPTWEGTTPLNVNVKCRIMKTPFFHLE